MKRYRQFQPVLISDFEVSEWHHPVHKHNHYEMIYIKKGTGKHYINQVQVAYKPGAVFFLGPEDEHYFEIGKPTRFVYIKFTDLYLQQEDAGFFAGAQRLEYLIQRRDVHVSGYRLSLQDQASVDQIFNVLISLKQDAINNEHIIWMQVIALSALLQRNLPELIGTAQQSRDMQEMFCYIHKYIYTPDKLRATVMAAFFNTTESYIGPYFKRNTGIALRDYIRDYRNSLIRKRIDSGHYSLKKIADEFGLTDESHVSKLMRKAG